MTYFLIFSLLVFLNYILSKDRGCWESLEKSHEPWKIENHCFKCLINSIIHFVKLNFVEQI